MPEGFGIRRQPPSGTIVMWDEPIAEIPSGWYLCDGNNGTPNLLDRFPRGASSGSDPGATGGEHSKTLATSQIPNHSHSAAVSSDGNHSHFIEYYSSANHSDEIHVAGGSSDDVETTSDGAHSHTFTSPSVGAGNSFDNRPSFYEVAFIMKA